MKIRHWRTGDKDWNAPQARDAGGRYVRRVMVRDERVWRWRADRRTIIILLVLAVAFAWDQAFHVSDPLKAHAATTGVFVHDTVLSNATFCKNYGYRDADTRRFCGL